MATIIFNPNPIKIASASHPWRCVRCGNKYRSADEGRECAIADYEKTYGRSPEPVSV